MAGTSVAGPRRTEISERSRELVLPGDVRDRSDAAASTNGSAGPPAASKEIRLSETQIGHATAPRRKSSADPSPRAASREAGAASADRSGATPAAARAAGQALPGDRGNASSATSATSAGPDGAQRPSFWRRIALGRRPNAAAETPPPSEERSEEDATRAPLQQLAQRAREVVAAPPRAATPPAVDGAAIEKRIVEPMLQALVSIEAKLERSHVELAGRSDQVEQRLTQLWDIEEQLGTLNELQESLGQVSEQQRRLEQAVVSQTRTLRWLVGAVFFSLAAAAFAVALLVRP